MAATATIAAIRGNVEKKLATWGPQLGDNGPRTLSDVVMPESYGRPTLEVEGHPIQIVGAEGLANCRYLWVPELHAIFGGVLVVSGLHLWIADTPTSESRAAWVKTLDAMAARKPRMVIPGHLAPGAATDAAAIHYSRDHLLAFEEALGKAADSAALVHCGSPSDSDPSHCVSAILGTACRARMRSHLNLTRNVANHSRG